MGYASELLTGLWHGLIRVLKIFVPDATEPMKSGMYPFLHQFCYSGCPQESIRTHPRR